MLGVPAGAGAAAIRAAWRRMARANHPDLTADDPDAVRRATRRMAEINGAYEALRGGLADGSRSRGRGDGDDGGEGSGRGAPAAPGSRRGGPPRPRPTRPVTGRLDTTETIRPRNATSGPGARPGGHPPRRAARPPAEPLRASDPNGPLERARMRRFRRPRRPSLAAAREVEITFGKFHGHRLGEIAAFEPSYIDWLARTIQHDRDLVSAARVIQDDLDARGVARRARPDARTRQRTA